MHISGQGGDFFYDDESPVLWCPDFEMEKFIDAIEAPLKEKLLAADSVYFKMFISERFHRKINTAKNYACGEIYTSNPGSFIPIYVQKIKEGE